MSFIKEEKRARRQIDLLMTTKFIIKRCNCNTDPLDNNNCSKWI